MLPRKKYTTLNVVDHLSLLLYYCMKLRFKIPLKNNNGNFYVWNCDWVQPPLPKPKNFMISMKSNPQPHTENIILIERLPAINHAIKRGKIM